MSPGPAARAPPPARPGPPPPAPGTALAIGRVAGDRVLVDDAAQALRVQQRTAAGVGEANGALALTLVEAAWLAADGRLGVRDGQGAALGFADLLLLAAKGGHPAEAHYLAYRDLRERGLVARPAAAGPGRFQAWPRGTATGEPAFTLRAGPEAGGLAAADLVAAARSQEVLCVADADGIVTHYQATLATPAGDVPDGDLPRAKGTVLSDRVLVSDAAAAKAYSQREFLGTLQPSGLLLSFAEAEALRRRGILAVPTGLAEATPEAALVLQAHLALRAAGAVPKSGFRFGTHVRAYRGAPDDGHAEWLVHCAASSDVLPWSLLSRGVRLAHGVRKSFLVAVPDGAGITFAHLAWFRP